MNKSIHTYILLLFVIMISCNKLSFRQSYSIGNSYSFNKSIILISDTTLNYSIRFGGIGSSTTISYLMKDSILIIDSVDIYGRKPFQDFTGVVFNHHFKYSKDSIIDQINNEIYYSEKYIDRNFKSITAKNFYVIIENKKKKVSSLNVKRIFNNIDTTKFELIRLDENHAEEKYGIKPKYRTFRLIEK